MKKNGYTLIELVVAIAILGVILIISIPIIRNIQNSNKDTKFKVYEKAINVAGKAYNDSYNEDLFGITNTGCAIISYNALKSKNLIEDIQVKGVDCNNQNTCVVVRKSKNGNYHYDTHLTCIENGILTYKTTDNPCDKSACVLEENGQISSAPIITIWDEGPYASKPYYKLFSTPKLKIKIEDLGVGLKANQMLNYQWYQNDTILSNDKGTINFKNDYYAPSATETIPLPSGIGTVTNNDVTYTLKITGSVQDVDNNTESNGKVHTITYHIETVKIKVNANGGYLANPHGAGISLNQNGDVLYSGNNNIMHTILRNKQVEGGLDGSLDQNGLVDWSSTGWLNLRKTGYTAKEWNTKPDGTGKAYNQNTAYKASDFCSLSEGDCEVQLYAIWRINVCTITYHPNGGVFTTNTNNTVQRLNYGARINDMRDANGGYYSAKNSYLYGKPGEEWKNGAATYNENYGFNATDICTNLKNADQSVTLYVNWFYKHCQSGNITYNQTITDSMVKKKDNSGIIVKVFHWNYKESHCNGTTKRRRYDFLEYGCACKIDKNSNTFCNDAVAYNRTPYTHTEGHATIYYFNTDNGEKACKANAKVNSYVRQVCEDGQYQKGNNYQYFHGYYFYKDKAVSPYDKISPSNYWYHTGGDSNVVIKSDSKPKEACKHACSQNYP